jgi:uncharacterized protein (DUF1330 family)
MIYITQLIYIIDRQAATFDAFEAFAIPIIAKYNGRLLLRIRPAAANMIEQTIETPYEIHVVEFDSDQDFENFKRDEDRKQFLHLKEQSIKTILMIKGEKI